MRLRNPQKASSPIGSIILYKIRIHLLKIFDLGVFSFCEFLMHINDLYSKLRFYIGIWVNCEILFDTNFTHSKPLAKIISDSKPLENIKFVTLAMAEIGAA